MSYKIGINHADLDYIYNQFPTFRSAVMPNPYSDPMEYSKRVKLLDGTVRELGQLNQGWHWAFMSEEQCETLRDYIGDVNVVTLNKDGTFSEYTATLEWPEKEPEHRSGRVLDITVVLTNLVAVV